MNKSSDTEKKLISIVDRILLQEAQLRDREWYIAKKSQRVVKLNDFVYSTDCWFLAFMPNQKAAIMNQKHYSDTVLTILNSTFYITSRGDQIMVPMFVAMMIIIGKYIYRHKIKKCLKNHNKGVVSNWNYSLRFNGIKISLPEFVKVILVRFSGTFTFKYCSLI